MLYLRIPLDIQFRGLEGYMMQNALYLQEIILQPTPLLLLSPSAFVKLHLHPKSNV